MSIRHIVYFVKVFDKEIYREKFLDGELFMNSISYFKNLEEKESSNRGDQYEALTAWLQPNQVTIKINDIEINSEHLAAPVAIQMNRHNYKNVLCLFAAYFNGESGTLHELREQLKVPEGCLKLGEYSVIIFNRNEFQKRIVSAVKANKYGLDGNLVDYYNPEDFHGYFDEKDVIFKKRNEFAHQQEYRFVVDNRRYDNSSLTLEIGDIRDIACAIPTSEINNAINVKPKK